MAHEGTRRMDINTIIMTKELGATGDTLSLGLSSPGQTIYYLSGTSPEETQQIGQLMCNLLLFLDLSEIPDETLSIIVNTLIMSLVTDPSTLIQVIQQRFRINTVPIPLVMDSQKFGVAGKAPDNLESNLQMMVDDLAKQLDPTTPSWDAVWDTVSEGTIDVEGVTLSVYVAMIKAMTNINDVAANYQRRMQAFISGGILDRAGMIPVNNAVTLAHMATLFIQTRVLLVAFLIGISAPSSTGQTSKIRNAASYLAGTGLTMFYQILIVMIRAKNPLLLLPGPISELPVFVTAIALMIKLADFGPYVRFIGTPDATIMAAGKFPMLVSITIGFLRATNPAAWGHYNYNVPNPELAIIAERFGRSGQTSVSSAVSEQIELTPEDLDAMSAAMRDFQQQAPTGRSANAPGFFDDQTDARSTTSRFI